MTESRIVVGVDESDEAQAALEWAITEAKLRGSPLEISHAWHTQAYLASASLGLVPVWRPGDGEFEQEQSHVQRWLDGLVALAQRRLDTPVTASTGAGSAASHLIGASEDAALLVVGSRGHGSLSGLVLGSTSQQLAAHARCPVVVVRGGATPQSSGPVVVGVDGSEPSTLALMAGHEEARLRNVPLVMVHSWWPSITGNLAPSYEGLDVSLAAEEDQGWRTLHEALTLLRSKGTGVEIQEQLQRGPAAASLVEASQSASLVVVGSRGRGGFAGLMLGSVSLAVLHDAATPVMVVRA